MTSPRAPRAGKWFAMLANAGLFEDGSSAMSLVGKAAVLVSHLYSDKESLGNFDASDAFIVGLRLASSLETNQEDHPDEHWLGAMHAARIAAACYQTGNSLGAHEPTMGDLNDTEMALLQSLGWCTLVPREHCNHAIQRLREQPHDAVREALSLVSNRVDLGPRLRLLVQAATA